MLAVLVTYGTRPNQTYANGLTTKEDAARMCQTAIEAGYPDARVIDEDDFREAQEAQRRSRAAQA